MLQAAQDPSGRIPEHSRPRLIIGRQDRPERVQIVARDDRSRRRQMVNELCVAVIDHVEAVVL
jgi:hypothetical protein